MTWYKLWKWMMNCILHCHNVQGRCIKCKQNYQLWFLCLRKITSLIIVKATQVIYIRKGSDLRKEKWGHRAFKRVKIAAKFSRRLSIRTVTPLREISETTWVHSYPMMPHAFTFYSCGLPSWSAIHDVCVTCAKKCAVAMGANVLKRCNNRKSCRRPVVSLSHATKSYRVNRPLQRTQIHMPHDATRHASSARAKYY